MISERVGWIARRRRCSPRGGSGLPWISRLASLGMAIGLCVAAAAEAETIDSILATAHRRAGVHPTALCDDATFYRRLSLDLIGRVPRVEELRAFMADPDRPAAIDRLLASDEHPRFWSQLWTTMLVGRAEQRGVEHEVLRRWLEEQIADRVRLDQTCFALLTAEGVSSLDGPVNYVVASRQDPVMRLSRTFLAVQLDCAECHDHPHDRWTNQDYVAMERFYRPTQFREVSGGIAVSDSGADSRAEKPVFLTGRKPHTAAWRRELGLMVVQSKPFSRAMVNRTWHWLMGRGIVDPVDALSRDNPASVPELLESLASDLRASDFDLRTMIREICLSDAYQRSTQDDVSSEGQQQTQLFAARTPRPQMPEQWIASVAIVLDRPLPRPAELAGRARQMLGLARQATPASDPFDWNATTQTVIRQLSGEIPAPLRDVDSMFLATLARVPSTKERSLVKETRSQDTLFALVHSSEFVMND